MGEQIDAVAVQVQEVLEDLRRIHVEKSKAEEALEELKRRKQKLEQSDIDTFHENMNKYFDREIQAIEKLPDLEKTQTMSVAVMGFTSAGKSSLLNQVFGLDLKNSTITCTDDVRETNKVEGQCLQALQVGKPDDSDSDDEDDEQQALDTVQSFQKFRHSHMVGKKDGIEVYDVFGDNDLQPLRDFAVLLTAKTIHTIIVVYTDCIDTSLKTVKLMKALKVDTIYFCYKSEGLDAEEVQLVLDEERTRIMETAGMPKRLIVGAAKTGMGCDELLGMLREKRDSLPSPAKKAKLR